MRIKRHRILTTVLVICVVAGLTANSSAKLNPQQESLRGVNTMTVEVICSGDAEETGLNKEDIGKDVRRQFEEAGIKIMPRQVWGRVPGRCRLKVMITVYKPSGLETFIYSLRVNFLQTVALERNPETRIDAVTWELTQLGNGSKSRLAEEMAENLKIMANSFIRDHRQANPPGGESSDAKDTKRVSVTAPKEQAKADTELAASEYRYVASKNSKVFHKPGCRWTTRIKPENLVGYSSKDEVIKAGKRPCKQCKP
jgi:hypothetical protein